MEADTDQHRQADTHTQRLMLSHFMDSGHAVSALRCRWPEAEGSQTTREVDREKKSGAIPEGGVAHHGTQLRRKSELPLS